MDRHDDSFLLKALLVESISRLSSDLIIHVIIFSCSGVFSLTDTHAQLSILSIFFLCFHLALALVLVGRQVYTFGLMMNDAILFVFDTFAEFAIGDQLHQISRIRPIKNK